jgi:long-chain acyl-CoA synthetase
MIGFWNNAEELPNEIAVIESDSGKMCTRGELASRTHQLVHMLRERGVTSTNVIAVVMENRTEFIEIFLAAMQAGLYFVPINYHLTAEEVTHILSDSDARAVFCSAEYAKTVLAAAETAGIDAKRRFVCGDESGFENYEDALRNQPTDKPQDRSEGLMMTYTSGTTGRPKGIKRPPSGKNPDEVGELWSHPMRIFGVEGTDHVHLVQSPMYHTAVLAYANASAQYGHAIVLMKEWAAERVLEVIETYKISTTHMVPTHFHRLLKIDESDRLKFDISSLKYVVHGAAPCPVETKTSIIEWFGPVVYEYYGASEGGGTTVNSTDWLKYPGTVGRPWTWAKIKICDDKGEEVPVGVQGIVWMLMGAFEFQYHKSPEKTSESKRDGFFTVGDLGHMNEDGFLFLHGRASEIIITGGVNIHPSEIEAVLHQHPVVADVAVFGIEDAEWGELIKCVVQLIPGANPDEQTALDLKSFCQEKLAKFKVPRSIDFIDQLPRDPNGKLYKRVLKEKYSKNKA